MRCRCQCHVAPDAIRHIASCCHYCPKCGYNVVACIHDRERGSVTDEMPEGPTA
jgi:hypothetical protein